MIWGADWTCECGWANLEVRKRCRQCGKDRPALVEVKGVTDEMVGVANKAFLTNCRMPPPGKPIFQNVDFGKGMRAALEAAALPALPGGVEVKKLEWVGPSHEFADGSGARLCEAECSPFGHYIIYRDDRIGGKFLVSHSLWTITGEHPTLEAAKAAAQADYERRVLSCLSAPVPATPAQGVAGTKLAKAMWGITLETPATNAARPLNGGARHPLEAYADSYAEMSRMGDGQVDCRSVEVDIRQNMIPVTQAVPTLNSGEVEALHLTEYEIQVLLGCSISGCRMSPDRVFSLPMAWHRLHAIDLIDRTDGLAIVTEKGQRVIASLLAALSSAPSTPEGWRSMDSAPMDGTAIWLLIEGQPMIGYGEKETVLHPDRFIAKFGFRRSDEDFPDDVYGTSYRADPTAWMPLPTPPAGGSDA